MTALPTVEAAGFPGSAGRALPGIELRVADADDAGVGEIQVRSRALFDGYLDDPAATAGVRTGDGWLRTGDLGRLDADGRLFVLDRRTDLIVRGVETSRRPKSNPLFATTPPSPAQPSLLGGTRHSATSPSPTSSCATRRRDPG